MVFRRGDLQHRVTKGWINPQDNLGGGMDLGIVCECVVELWTRSDGKFQRTGRRKRMAICGNLGTSTFTGWTVRKEDFKGISKSRQRHKSKTINSKVSRTKMISTIGCREVK